MLRLGLEYRYIIVVRQAFAFIASSIRFSRAPTRVRVGVRVSVRVRVRVRVRVIVRVRVRVRVRGLGFKSGRGS